MKRGALLGYGLLIVAILALASFVSIQSTNTTTPSTVLGTTEDFLAKPVDVQGDLAGVGGFNYTYCAPQCQALQSTTTPNATVPPVSAVSAVSSIATDCGTVTDPLDHYVCTHTNSNVCVTCTTGTATTNTYCGPLCQFTQTTQSTSQTSYCGPYCSFTKTHVTSGSTTTSATTVTHGHAQIAVILAAFKDVAPNRTVASISSEWNSKVTSYYSAISHGKFDAAADFFGWYTLPNIESYYGADCPEIPATDCGIAGNTYDFSWTLARDAVDGAQYYGGLNITQYQYLVVMHSGNGQESEGKAYPNDVWSVTYFQGPPAGRDAQHGIFTEYSIVPETERNASPVGIWAAEFGHQQGFPDMFYSTESTTMAKTGRWELESLGAWNGNPAGSDPAYTLTINQENRGWLQGHFVQVYTQATHGVGNGTATIQLTEVEKNSGNMSIEVITSGHAAFYWIEARKQVGWDKGIPMNGVLIGTINHSVGFDASAFKLMNADPSDPTLNHAAFQVGQTYKDSFITIAIESYSNGVFVINIT